MFSQNIQPEVMTFSQQHKLNCDSGQISQGFHGVAGSLRENASKTPAECTDQTPTI